MGQSMFAAISMLAASMPATPVAAQAMAAIAADPAPDPAHPAGIEAFVLPVAGGAVNAVLYTASGARPHPTMLLLHGFPGNEQNLDLAQAARRAGWNVLTLHYRGSWGSPGRFSLGGAANDARSALAFLRRPDVAARYAIDPARIVVAGHSMGGFMAADAAAADPGVRGLVLIDAWDIAGTAAALDTPEGRAAWAKEAAGDLPPLAGTDAAALAREMKDGGARFDLSARVTAYGRRPLLVLGAARGMGPVAEGRVEAAGAAAGATVTGTVMATDHSFSDHRIALETAVLAWLAPIAR